MTPDQAGDFAEDIKAIVEKYDLRTFAFVYMHGANHIGIRCNAGCVGTDEDIQNNFAPCANKMVDALMEHLVANDVVKRIGRG